MWLDWRARREFQAWKKRYPLEAQAMAMLDTESRYKPGSDSHERRKQIYEAARDERRSLGLGDNAAAVAGEPTFRVLEQLAENHNLTQSPEEAARLLVVNEGWWKRVGAYIPGRGRLERVE